jgi:hypothetical protein
MLTLCGCGGGAASGAGPETGGANEEKEATTEPANDTDAKPKTPEEAGGDEGQSTPPEKTSSAPDKEQVTTLEGDDLEAVLHSVLSDPELLDHLHLDKPGRAPLKISGQNLPEKLQLVVGSYDVKVVPEPTSKKAPVMVFTLIERSGDQARVHYRFDVEGIHGSATVNLKNGRWLLGANHVIEK